MVEDYKLVWILAVGLGCATVSGYIMQRLKLSPILGYLLAGFFLGPHFGGILADQGSSFQLANIGVTLLMFSVGLSFKWQEILSVKSKIVPGVALLAVCTLALSVLAGHLLGLGVIASVVIGIALSVSSTVVCVRLVSDHNLLKSKQGYLVIAWTIVDDLVSIIGLILLPALAVMAAGENGDFSWKVLGSIGLVFLKLGSLALLIYFFGKKIISKLLHLIAKEKSHELLTLAILSMVFLLALGSSYLFGISVALGAFVAGTIIGNTEMSYQATADAIPTRDAFAVIFFLSIGMLFDPSSIWHHKELFFAMTGIVVVFRPLLILACMKLGKYPLISSLTLACAISQIGEYSFIIAEEAVLLKLFPAYVADSLIACAFVTIALNSLLFELLEKRFTTWIIPDQRAQIFINDSSSGFFGSPGNLKPKALVIGFSHVGQAASLKLASKYDVTVIDKNISVFDHKFNQLRFIYGDACQIGILQMADLSDADLVIVTTPDSVCSKTIVAIIRQTRADLPIIQRLHNIEDIEVDSDQNTTIVCDENSALDKMLDVILKLPIFYKA